MIAALRQGIATLLIAVAPVVLLEGGLRLAGWPTQRVRTFGKLVNFDAASWERSIGVFMPGSKSTVMWPPELSYEVQVNSLGLRGPEIEKRPPPGRTRILALGDSMTFGYYLEEYETWPARLEARLRDAGHDVEVVNGGSGGWTIRSETLFLEERAIALEPDHVLIGFCANDIADLEREGSVYQSQKAAIGYGRGPVLETLYTSAIYELYLRVQVAWKRFREDQTGEREHPLTSVDVPEERADALWAEYALWLDRMNALLASRGVPITIVYIPDVYKLTHDLPAHDADRLRALAAARGIGFVSPLTAFEPRPRQELFLLPLDDHLSPQGAEVVAEEVARALAPRLASRERR